MMKPLAAALTSLALVSALSLAPSSISAATTCAAVPANVLQQIKTNLPSSVIVASTLVGSKATVKLATGDLKTYLVQSSGLLGLSVDPAGASCLQTTAATTIKSQFRWTKAQAWAALRSIPSIHAVADGGDSIDLHIVGPATKAGDAFQPTRVTPITPVGKGTSKTGWAAFEINATVAVNGEPDQTFASFCLIARSKLRTTYPFSKVEIENLSLEFVRGGGSCTS